jgi:hypothetical protein
VNSFIGDCIIAQIQTTVIIMAILFVHVNQLAIKKDGLVADRKILMMAGDVHHFIKMKRLMSGQVHVNMGRSNFGMLNIGIIEIRGDFIIDLLIFVSFF